MSKNKKSFTRQRINLPEVIDSDSIAYASDDDLSRRLDYLYSEKDKAYEANYDLSPWEVEICYVQREFGIRNNRKYLHEKYVKEHRFEDHDNGFLN